MAAATFTPGAILSGEGSGVQGFGPVAVFWQSSMSHRTQSATFGLNPKPSSKQPTTLPGSKDKYMHPYMDWKGEKYEKDTHVS